MTKRARPLFRCLRYETGQPWILMEYFDGDNLDLFQKTIGFDLPKDTPLVAADQNSFYHAPNLGAPLTATLQIRPQRDGGSRMETTARRSE
jgi:hypothetical protein